jgi:ABC-type Fe3+/spermidine/putrescine transport system ATPase subunit
MAPLIDVRNLTKTYTLGDVLVHALQGVTVTVERGSFVAVTGPSGSGKSTLMHILGCLDSPTSGRYLLDGHDVSRLSGDELAAVRNTKIGFVFQGFNLLARTSALDNVDPRPAAPRVTAATSGNGRATVSWTAARTNPTSPVTGYVVLPLLDGVPQTASTFNNPATNETVTGLTNGADYTFRVAAFNANGAGPTSSPGGFTTIGAPGIPAAVTAAPGNRQAAVKWTAPPSNGLAIAGYTVLNDVSMRDWQNRTVEWLQGKTFEATTPVGPWLTTPDEVDHAADLELRCEVDGVVMQASRTSDLLFNLENNKLVVATADTWQVRGVPRVLAPGEYPDQLGIAKLPEAAWCEVVEIRPTRLRLHPAHGQAQGETIDIW